MKHRGGNIFLSIDWVTVLIYTALVILGWINIYSAVYDESHSSILSMSQRYGKQLVWIGIAYAIITIVMAFQARAYSIFAYIVYGLFIIALILVLILGTKTNGARSWFVITDSIKFQPAEFAKFATALAIAKLMSSFDFDISSFTLPCIKNMMKIAAIILMPAILILLQPDMGSVLVYASMIFVMYREGLPGYFLALIVLAIAVFIATLLYPLWVVIVGLLVLAEFIYFLHRQDIVETAISTGVLAVIFGAMWACNHWLMNDKYAIDRLLLISTLISSVMFLVYAYLKKNTSIAVGIVILAGSLVLMFSVDYIFHNIMTQHQQTLINVFLGVENDPQGTGYNVEQSKIAIGSGGLTGKGFLEGTQTKFNFVPEQATDFIFCTVGEEWGFVGATVIIGLFVFLIIRIMWLAEQQRSSFSRIYGYCVASILFLHLAINVGMTIGMVPVIGIPLPFFSYGGSSLWSFTILLFIFIRLDASRDEQL
ncbi:MAG: rod shape-determining protein RodA [Bacteroidales bacterium]|nr:rod shape-determining protein RodA [Bacteroidales bacterium]